MPISIWPSGSSNVGTPAAGSVQGASATPMLRVFGRPPVRVTACTSASDAPAAAAAPATLYRKKIPAMPRRRLFFALRRRGHVVRAKYRRDLDALGRGDLGGEVEVHHVAAVVAVQVQDAGARIDRRVTSSIWSALGDANTLPIAAPSASPSPT